VLKDGVQMVVQTTAPVKGYGTMLAQGAKMKMHRPKADAVIGPFVALDQSSKQEWQASYAVRQEKAAIGFEVGCTDGVERPAVPTFATSHVAKLAQTFHPLHDGIHTYCIKVEGHTASGASYSRVRTVSKYIRPRTDIKQSTVVLQLVSPQQPQMLRLTLTPKDLYGNLVGPGISTDISVTVDKGALRGKVEDLLDGSYAVEIEATERPEATVATISMEDVLIPVPMSTVVPPATAPIPALTAELAGKVEQLRFDEKGNFLGFVLRTLTGMLDIASFSNRLAKLLADAMVKDLTVVISRDQATGEIAQVFIETP
jgi:hypothetical protein